MQSVLANSRSINGYSISAFINKKALADHLRLTEFKGILVAMNAEKILKNDVNLKKLVNSNLGYTDGIGAVWALKKKGLKSGKIAGVELWLEIIKQNYMSKAFYLIGSKREVINLTVERLIKEYPGINIVGYNDGYLKDGDQFKILKDFKSLKPDIVFVAMGSPKQEFFMQELLNSHKALYMGLGGSFDVYTGKIKRAPDIWNNLNLEWAYRLVKQPKRILRQFHLLRFLIKLLFNRL